MSGLILREAGPSDLALLQGWQQQPHVIAAGAGGDWQWETELARKPGWRQQWIAELDGRAIGFIEIIDPAREDSHYWGEIEADLRALDIWIGEAGLLGQGHGSEMMRLALARCFADARVSAVLVDPLAANTRAHRFYARLGFEVLERRQFDDDDCLVMRLHRADWQAQPLNPVR